MAGRSPAEIDTELSAAVKSRDGHRRAISQLSEAIIRATRRIDELLAERAEL